MNYSKQMQVCAIIIKVRDVNVPMQHTHVLGIISFKKIPVGLMWSFSPYFHIVVGIVGIGLSRGIPRNKRML